MDSCAHVEIDQRGCRPLGRAIEISIVVEAFHGISSDRSRGARHEEPGVLL